MWSKTSGARAGARGWTPDRPRAASRASGILQALSDCGSTAGLMAMLETLDQLLQEQGLVQRPLPPAATAAAAGHTKRLAGHSVVHTGLSSTAQRLTGQAGSDEQAAAASGLCVTVDGESSDDGEDQAALGGGLPGGACAPCKLLVVDEDESGVAETALALTLGLLEGAQVRSKCRRGRAQALQDKR